MGHRPRQKPGPSVSRSTEGKSSTESLPAVKLWSSRTKAEHLWILFGLALATVAVYLPVTRHEFILLDDNHYITGNPVVTEGLSWRGLAWAFTTFHAANWHPLTWLSHMLDCQLFGLNAGAHHSVNVLIHIANTLLLYLALRRATGAMWRSAIVAALFALHPLHVESVAWASERKDTLSAFFGLLTFLSYLRYSEARSMVRLGLVALTLACGLMAKSMLVTWPFLLLLLDFWPLRRLQLNGAVRWKERIAALWPLLREKLPLFGLVLASVVMTMLSQKSGGAFEAFSEAPLSVRLSNAIVSYAKYIGAIFWPTHLAAYYYFPTHGLPAAHVIAALLLLIALTAGLFLARSRPYLIVGWLWFLGTLVPVIGVVQVGGQAMADHYTYLPSIGLFVAVVFGVADLAAVWQLTRAPLAGAAAVVLLAASCVTARQLGYWRDSETLFRHTLANTSENPPIEYNLGCVLARSGRHEEALPHFDKLLRADPDSHAALLSKGAALSDLGRTREAGEHFQRAIKRVPHSVQAHTQYALLLAKQGEGEQALVHFRHASDLAPRDASARTNLGVMLTRLDRMIEAEGELIEAVRLNPKNAEAHSGLGFALLESGRPGESIPAFLTALRLKPDLSSAQQNLERAHAMLASSK